MDYYEIKNREYNFPVSGVQTEEWCEMESREREREKERERESQRIGHFCNVKRELL